MVSGQIFAAVAGPAGGAGGGAVGSTTPPSLPSSPVDVWPLARLPLSESGSSPQATANAISKTTLLILENVARLFQEPAEQHVLRGLARDHRDRVDQRDLLRTHLDAVLRLAAV